MVTREVLKAVAPNAREARIKEILDNKDILASYGIKTPLRLAHFLAQVSHESGGFMRMEENLIYSDPNRIAQIFRSDFDKNKDKKISPEELEDAKRYVRNKVAIANRVYENQNGNGNEASGDGWKYRGRGFIQLTGKSNYAAAGKALKMNLVDNPDKASEVKTALEVAAWYFESRGCNKAADNDSLNGVTRLINGALVGLSHREQLLKEAKKALGI